MIKRRRRKRRRKRRKRRRRSTGRLPMKRTTADVFLPYNLAASIRHQD